MTKFKKIVKGIRNLYLCFINDLLRRYVHQYFPARPTVINFNVNDICNSKCVMCNIWRQKQDFEITSNQFKDILTDKLFNNVTHVGITGGEPTLREDLAQFYKVACETLSRLKGMSMITNAIRETQVIKAINDIHALCTSENKSFSVMVSLDGVDEIHDKVRGREGNFISALNVLSYCKNQLPELPLTIGCTISKENVWSVDDLLDFLKENNINGRYRIAEFINRLYNNDKKDIIRNFNDEEGYHLMCFFKKLELTYERNESHRRTYRSIINILNGGGRTIGCPYHDKGVVLDSRGNIQYCAPKSKILGSSLEKSAKEIYKDNLAERRRILKENCSGCVHDYHSAITFKEKLTEYLELGWSHFYKFRYSFWQGLLRLALKLSAKGSKKVKRIFIVGWYGTETVGDKAILGHIADYYKSLYDKVEIAVSSLYPFVTHKTCKELNINALVVPVNSWKFAKWSAQADEIIMGGGPLMNLDALRYPLWAFRIANSFKKKTVIFGCGIGPLTEDLYRNAVKEMLTIATEVKVRDSHSLRLAKDFVGIKKEVHLSGDGAVFYVQKFKKNSMSRKPLLACFLRELTTEYRGTVSLEQYSRNKILFEQNLAKLILHLKNTLSVGVGFFPMHTFVVGNDDRDFFRRFKRTYFADEEDVFYHNKNSSVQFITDTMQEASYSLCMRFHSVVFAHVLGLNYFAIDYTNGGKIAGFLDDANARERMMSVDDLITSDIGDLALKVSSVYLSTVDSLQK